MSLTVRKWQEHALHIESIGFKKLLYEICGVALFYFFNFSYCYWCCIIQALAFQVEDYGKDLDGVEGLQRKQDADERGMSAIYKRIQVSIM